MAIKARSATSTDLVSSTDAYPYIKALKDGTVSMLDFVSMMCLEGRVFSVQGGSVTSPITYGAGDLLETEPDLMVLVPSGTTIIPLDILFTMETYGTTQLFEYMASIGQGATAALGTDTDVTPVNVNLGSTNASSCTCGVAANTGTATYPTSKIIEFWRGSETVAVDIATADDDSKWIPVNFTWSAKKAGYWPILVGPGSFQVYAAAQAGTGFISARYLEIPSSWLS